MHPQSFSVMWSRTAANDAGQRWSLASSGVHMVSSSGVALKEVLQKIKRIRELSAVLSSTGGAMAGARSIMGAGGTSTPGGGATTSSTTSSTRVVGGLLHRFSGGIGGGGTGTTTASSSAVPGSGHPPSSSTPGGGPSIGGGGPGGPPPPTNLSPPPYSCPLCRTAGLSDEALWLHFPLFHVNASSRKMKGHNCPVCNSRPEPNLQMHIRNAHGPCALGLVASEFREPMQRLNCFALVVAVDNVKDPRKILLVQEFGSSGWWWEAVFGSGFV